MKAIFSTRSTLPIALALGVVACSHGVGDGTTETTQQAATEEPAEAPDARSEAHHHQRGPGPGDPAKFIEKFDDNGDGVLETSELPERKRQRLSAADTNKDGRLSVEELAAHKPHRHHRGFAADPAKLIERFDKNGDGVLELTEFPDGKRERFAAADTNQDGRLSNAEIEAHHQKMAAHFHGKGKLRDPGKFIEKFDKNGDGKLELSELPERFSQRIAVADTNGDKQLSSEELTAHFEARRAERRGRFGGDGGERKR